MDKRQRIAGLTEDEQERILLARVYDRLHAGTQREIPAFTCFLTPRQQMLTKQLLSSMPLHFFGGLPEAERQVCAFLPEYYDPELLWDEELSPICALRASHYPGDSLTHRDILGALMACGVKRETVGDICISPAFCDFFVTRELAEFLCTELKSAGRTALHVSRIPLREAQTGPQRLREIRTTVSSLRLDSVVGAGFGLARAKAAAAIEAGKVSVNGLVTEKPDKAVSQGDKIALRGMGKLCLTEVGGKSRKDRLCLCLSRYE